MKHSNVFYKRNKDGQYEAVKDAKTVRNKAGIDLFRVGFTVHEGKTGLIIDFSDNMEQVKMFVAKLETDATHRERCLTVIEDEVKKKGLTPRYTRPDEKYDTLFPKPEKKDILAPGLDGKKHYFSEVHNQDGIALYTMKNRRQDPWTALYLLYEGHMLNVGNLSDLDRLVGEYKLGVPDYRQSMTERLEEALANPDKWANLYFAKFLGRLEEAQAHNQPIREAREQERQVERLERERQEQEQRLQEQREYEAAILKAEQTIMNKQELVDDDVRGTSLILQVFRENGVELPLKTQGWVKSSLHSIYHNEQQDYWSYKYTGRPSTVIHDYIEKLVAAVQSRHGQMAVPGDDAQLEDEEDMEL